MKKDKILLFLLAFLLGLLINHIIRGNGLMVGGEEVDPQDNKDDKDNNDRILKEKEQCALYAYSIQQPFLYLDKYNAPEGCSYNSKDKNILYNKKKDDSKPQNTNYRLVDSKLWNTNNNFISKECCFENAKNQKYPITEIYGNQTANGHFYPPGCTLFRRYADNDPQFVYNDMPLKEYTKNELFDLLRSYDEKATPFTQNDVRDYKDGHKTAKNINASLLVACDDNEFSKSDEISENCCREKSKYENVSYESVKDNNRPNGCYGFRHPSHGYMYYFNERDPASSVTNFSDLDVQYPSNENYKFNSLLREKQSIDCNAYSEYDIIEKCSNNLQYWDQGVRNNATLKQKNELKKQCDKFLKNIPYTFFTKDNLKTAVDKYLEDQRYAEAKYGHIKDWDVSRITDMSDMFNGATAFNGDLSNWKTGNASDMSRMFKDADAFNGGDLSNWDVSRVTDMSGMFQGATAFSGSGLSSWNTGRVTDMSGMFNGTEAFNGNISNWNTGRVTNMSYMFYYAIAFNGDISGWGVSSGTNISYMFTGATTFNNGVNKEKICNSDSWKIKPSELNCPPPPPLGCRKNKVKECVNIYYNEDEPKDLLHKERLCNRSYATTNSAYPIEGEFYHCNWDNVLNVCTVADRFESQCTIKKSSGMGDVCCANN